MSVTIENHLIVEFIKAMEDIGEYGYSKYGENSFEILALNNNRVRSVRTACNTDHIFDHNAEYIRNEKHDYFRTLKHQLAAVAFNAMMEFYYARLDEKESEK
jgi:hypothetical protein